jgi:hypothetical protein
MAWKRYEIESYQVRITAQNTRGYDELVAFIYLGWGGARRATLWFYELEVEIQPNAEIERDDFVEFYARYKATQYDAAIDLLRYERPVYFYWDPETKGAFIGTADKAIGDRDSNR